MRLRDLSKKWLKPNERSKEELVDVIIQEQLVNTMSRELQLRVRERKPKTAGEAGTIADDIISAREGTFGMTKGSRKCLKCGLPGHLARDCRTTTKKDGNILPESREDWKRSENTKKQETNLTCYRCGKLEHIASRCPIVLPNYSVTTHGKQREVLPIINQETENTCAKDQWKESLLNYW